MHPKGAGVQAWRGLSPEQLTPPPQVLSFSKGRTRHLEQSFEQMLPPLGVMLQTLDLVCSEVKVATAAAESTSQ